MINRATLLAWPFKEVVHTYTARDAMLYAASLGFGSDPMDAAQLRHVLEDRLRVFPTMAVVLAHPGPWTSDPATGIDHTGAVHGEQSLVLHRPLPTAGTVRSRNRVVAVHDKGAGKGAVILTERHLHDADSGDLLATLAMSIFCRRDGGFDSDPGPPANPASDTAPPSRPGRAADAVLELPTSPQAALLYRLNGDRNPLHSHPEAARAAGFERPIAHGMFSFGLCARMLETQFAPRQIESISARFSAPMYPGETLVTEMWQGTAGEVWFRGLCKERGVEVITRGYARLIGS